VADSSQLVKNASLNRQETGINLPGTRIPLFPGHLILQLCALSNATADKGESACRGDSQFDIISA
jgi:hypothetical protein